MAKKTPTKSAPKKASKKAGVRSASAKKPAAKASVPPDGRALKPPRYRSFRLQKRIKHPYPKLPNSFRLFGRATGLLIRHWKLFGGIALIYGILNTIFVTGFGAGSDLSTLKDTINEITSGLGGSFTTGITLFVYLLGTAGNTTNATAGAYQFLLVFIVSLVFIWALRHVVAQQKISIRDAYYKGIAPFVPFLLVLLTIVLQLLPALIGGALYKMVSDNGIAVFAVEKVIWFSLFASLVLLSLYMVCSSVFALYIVTLPDMTPMKALRSARELVLHRRWSIMRKVLFLPVALVLLGALIMIPTLMFVTPVAAWMFLLLSALGIAILHSYLFALYRSLL